MTETAFRYADVNILKGYVMKTINISWRRYLLPPINPDGVKFIVLFALATALLAIMWEPLGLLGAVATVWCFYFFRDPLRVVPQIKDVVVSPADGLVQMITKVKAPEELEIGDAEFTRVSIFMSVFSVHVNRAPAAGTITKAVYVPGKFVNATLDKASKDNERQLIAMKTAGGKEIAFVQIAGLVARRIVCNAKIGDKYKAGERFGHIRFGSRLDVYLPQGVEPQVCLGQVMVAGETVLANLSSDAPAVKGEVE